MKRKRKGFFLVKFFRIDFIVLATLAITAFMLVGGVVPQMEFTPAKTGEELIPIPNSGTGGGQSSLQLNPIKFNKCTGTAAIDFLIDRSSSMQGTKITELKKAVLTFTGQMSDDSVIAIQDFSSPLSPYGTVRELVPFSYLKNVKTNLPTLVNNIQAYGNTHTKDAFIFTQQKLNAAIPNYPKYKFALIFISDGSPFTGGGGFFDPAQDPTAVANQIKTSGVRIFTIAYVDRSDAANNTKLQQLMQQVASNGDYTMAPDASKIGDILSKIATKMCETAQ